MGIFKKTFRIIKEKRVTGILPYAIQQRHTILFVFHFWSSPEFEPPHLFETANEAYKAIKEHYSDAIIYLRISKLWQK